MKQIYLLLFLCLAFAAPAFSQTTWIGAQSTDWNEPLNWSPSAVPTATDYVVIPDTTNQPTITTAAVANSVEVQTDAALTIEKTGSLTINGSIQLESVSTSFLNYGMVDNSGQLIIQPTVAADIGLTNVASFNNNTGGQITIDNTIQAGLLNVVLNSSIANFTNSGSIVIGANASVGQYGLANNGTFNNNTTGHIAIDSATTVGLSNNSVHNSNLFGTFTNAGSLFIGANASVGATGIENIGRVNNSVGGNITIDRSTTVGLSNRYRTFTNAGRFVIGASAPVGATAIENDSTFNNTGCGALLQVLSDAIITDTLGGLTTNSGTIIENASGTSNIATNTGRVQNLNGGSFNITNNTAGVNTTAAGILWTGCTSTDWNTASNWSSGTVPTASDSVVILPATYQPTITTAAVAHSVDVQSNATLTNSGSLTINGSKVINVGYSGNYFVKAAFFNLGKVDNYGQLVIGNSAAVGDCGLLNRATFNNNSGGEIHIDNATQSYLFNYDGTFNNASTIILGAQAPTTNIGVQTYANFNNNSGGAIHIDNTTYTGIYNTGAFTNVASLVIGANATAGQYGLYSLGSGTFNNSTGGAIEIDRSTTIGLNTTGDSFTNAGSIVIGAHAPVGQYGLLNSRAFENNTGGTIRIDNATDNGLFNRGVSFTNAGSVTIGANTSVGQYGLDNQSPFTNSPCASLTLFAPLSNSSTFTNAGLMTVSTTGVHSNTALTNNGVLSYPKGNPIANVTNNDLILLPKGTCSTSVLQIGGSNHFTVGTTWYKDPALTTAAGTYNGTTNTFTAAGLTTGTVYPLYFSVTDNSNGACAQTASLTDTAQSCGPCANAKNLTTATITATSATLNWVASANPVQWQVQYKTTSTGAKWVDVFVEGNARSTILTGLKAIQTYQWHIRAKCGKTWTSYSNVVGFKTLSSTQSTPIVQAKPVEEPGNVVETNARLTLHPNPSSGRFIINLHLLNNNSTKAKIELVNLLGQTVYTENGSINNGKLQQTVSMPSVAAHGMYIVRVIANNKVYQQKLIYTK
jgi:hypothetical protein